MTPLELDVRKYLCETDHLYFTRYFFKARQNLKFRVNWHHVYLAEELEKVFTGETENLVINVPPGSSKTEMAIINFICRGLARNPWARFLHISYADDLALLNSTSARELLQSDEFQEFWPMKISEDAKSKKRWNIMAGTKKAGGVYAVSLGGQITGFRAGHMAEGFQGAILIDDPLKPEDAYSATKRKRANRQLLSTVKSRKANPKTPIVLIMQRIHDQDPSAFIEAGNLPGKWKHIVIPALIDDAYVAALPEHIQKLIDRTERDEIGRFSYWPYKEPLADLLAMEKGSGKDQEGNQIGKHVFSGQYQQRPSLLGGDIIQSKWFKRYSILPPLKYRMIYADTAQKTKERNDWSVFTEIGMGQDGNLYILNITRGKWQAPELRQNAKDVWSSAKSRTNAGMVRKMKVEDKSSGTGLVQDLERGSGIPIEGIERSTDKLTRVMDAVPYIESGMVFLPEEAPWVSALTAECDAFTADDSHLHDDQIDTLCDAINDNLAKKKKGFFS